MPDPRERRSPPAVAHTGGLPIATTAKLTAAERGALLDLIDALRALGEQLGQAFDQGELAPAIDALNTVAEGGLCAARLAGLLGANR